MRFIWILVAAWLGLVPVSRGNCPSQTVEKRMENEKRAAPAVVEAVSHDGTRYEEVQFEKSEGLDQNSGYLAAIDMASGNRKWLLKVYDVCYSSDLEADLQDVFFKRLELAADGRTLIVTNEEERRFAVDLADRTVRELKP